MGLSTGKEKEPRREAESEANEVRSRNKTNKAVMLSGLKRASASEDARAGGKGRRRQPAMQRARGASRKRE